eukprot:g15707.t1
METLCLAHPRYKDWAEFRAKKAEEKQLQEELELKNKTEKLGAPGGPRRTMKDKALEKAKELGQLSSPRDEEDQE